MFKKYRNPVGVITKNNLITRDIDILADLLDRVGITDTVKGMDGLEDLGLRAHNNVEIMARDALDVIDGENIQGIGNGHGQGIA